mmetsp:Transcript_12856/g.1947  ORF Transcript_12856/g.1947 Transcript_12856/m.1947 type:complete len:99 (-) Transcript_12856:36-332(-)
MWYYRQYGINLNKKKTVEEVKENVTAKAAQKYEEIKSKWTERQESRFIDPHVEEQFTTGRLLAAISSRPGQSGRCDGYILEGDELDFYKKKMIKRKNK